MTHDRRGNEHRHPATTPNVSDEPADEKQPWVSPELEELPPLRDLTLQTGSGIGGDESVFP